METKILMCECVSAEHQILINFSEDEFGKTVYLDPHLVTYNNFFKRVIVGFKYMFGYKSKYGQWDEIILTKDNYKPLKDVVEFLEEDGKE